MVRPRARAVLRLMTSSNCGAALRAEWPGWRLSESCRRTTAEIEDAGQQELLNWVCLAGAMDALGCRAEIVDWVETLVFNSSVLRDIPTVTLAQELSQRLDVLIGLSGGWRAAATMALAPVGHAGKV